jgi:hypothetical protein
MAFRRIMERAGVAAGIARKAEDGTAGRNVSARSFHSLRHGFVTALAHANVAIELRKKKGKYALTERAFLSRVVANFTLGNRDKWLFRGLVPITSVPRAIRCHYAYYTSRHP